MAGETPRLDESLTERAAGEAALRSDAEISRLRAELSATKAKYSAALRQIEAERERANAIAGLTGLRPAKIPRTAKAGRGSATAVLVLSDWHVEELVRPETVGGLNQFDLSIADRRIGEVCSRAAMLIEHESRLAKIRRIVVCALGDFISNIIHDDTAELAQLAPLAAIRWAGERLRSVIDMAAGMAEEVQVVTAVGNHGRTTMKPRIATENDHSFEQHLYLSMQSQETNKNVVWRVSEGYLNTVDLDGFMLRTHHGHAIKYQGGVGGIAVGANKAISQWNRAARADLDVFGHWHQWSWLNNRYVSNGSLIGHSAYAVRIKAEYERPCQSLLVIDHSRNCVTRAMPVFCDSDLKDAK